MMTTEALPRFSELPEVQSMASLLASSDQRFETGEHSTWFTEMSKQLIDFEASGYRCIDILQPGEDNPTEVEIDAATQTAIEERDVAVMGAIKTLGVAMRRHAKSTVNHCPVDGDEYVEDVIDWATRDNVPDQKAARRLKPEMYGKLGVVVKESVEATLSRRKDPSMGEFGLYAAQLTRRPAVPEDVDSWSKLRRSWTRTLQASVEDAMTEGEQRRDPRLVVMNRLFNEYAFLHGIGPASTFSAHDQLDGGCGTASNACMRLAYAMDKYLVEEHGMTDPDERTAIIGHSNGPVGKMAGLSIDQQDAFSEAYLGANPENVDTDFAMIRTDMLLLGNNGRINFVLPIEELPLPNGQLVGKFGKLIRRIGCPILLTPQLTQELWGSFVESADQAGLIKDETKPVEATPSRLRGFLKRFRKQ